MSEAGRAITSAEAPAEAPERRPPGDPQRWFRKLIGAHELSPAQRRIAHYMAEHLEETSYASVVEMGERVGVSQPSVTRFAVALGFNSYPEFRAEVREQMLQSRQPDTAEVSSVNSELQDAVRTEIRNLQALEEALADPSDVYALAGELAASRPLLVVGARVGAPLAHLFAHFAAKVLPDVRLYESADSATDEALLQGQRAGATWVLGIVMPRYPRELLSCLGRARSSSLKVGVIAGGRSPKLSGVADVVLSAGVGSRLVFDSQAAPMVLTAVLLQAICDVMPAEAEAKLEQFEHFAARHRLFAE